MTMIRPGVYGLSCDVTEDEQVGSLFQTVGARFQGQLDLLVNCAGVMSGGDPTHITSAEFGRVLQVNVVAPFVCSREAILMMKAKGDGGRILNIGSIAAIAPRPESAPYSVSKAALGMLTQSLSLDARQFGAPFCRALTHPGGDDLFDPVAHSVRGLRGRGLAQDDWLMLSLPAPSWQGSRCRSFTRAMCSRRCLLPSRSPSAQRARASCSPRTVSKRSLRSTDTAARSTDKTPRITSLFAQWQRRWSAQPACLATPT